MYLNQLPQTEIARLKAELAETLIAHFCYPRFYDYRANALRMRPVDRAKRQEVWHYLNAVDFNVWGRVEVDSPDFQRQVERLFIHFVQRNRSFFGQQGRKRMTDVRALIASCSSSLAQGLRGHLRGQQETPPFGSPRPVSSWSAARGTGPVDLPWEHILAESMQMQAQLQEVRGEASSAPLSSATLSSPIQAPTVTDVSNLATRQVRPTKSPTVSNGVAHQESHTREDEALAGPSTGKGSGRSSEVRISAPFPAPPKEAAPTRPAPSSLAKEAGPTRPSFPPSPGSVEASPTSPLALSRMTNAHAETQQHTPVKVPAHSKPMKPAEATPAISPVSVQASSSPSKGPSQPLPTSSATASTQIPQVLAVPKPKTEVMLKPAEDTTVLVGDEDVVIFEQMRHQLVLWLRVETVRSGLELGAQSTSQLVETLRHQEGMDMTRLQVISTLLNMCDQIITSGRASLFDYKQAMMFYLMHTRRSH